MNIKFYVVIVAFLMSLNSTVIAASFDCNKARGFVEQTICTTPELSTLDEQLSFVYKKVNSSKSGNVDSLKKSQQLWLKNERNKAKNAQEIKDTYTQRISVLNIMLDKKNTLPLSVAAEKKIDKDPGTLPEEYYCNTAMQTDGTVIETSEDQSWNGVMMVSDYGDKFIIHFNNHYNFGDFDSGKISLLKERQFLNIKKEVDNSISYYLKQENKLPSYQLTNHVNNKIKFKFTLYGCSIDDSQKSNKKYLTFEPNRDAKYIDTMISKGGSCYAEHNILDELKFNFMNQNKTNSTQTEQAVKEIKESERNRWICIEKEFNKRNITLDLESLFHKNQLN